MCLLKVLATSNQQFFTHTQVPAVWPVTCSCQSLFTRPSKEGHYVAVMVSQHDEPPAAAPLSMAGPECWDGDVQAGGALHTAADFIIRSQPLTQTCGGESGWRVGGPQMGNVIAVLH